MSDEHGNRVIVINPDLHPEERKLYEKEAKARGIRVADLEEFPKLRGRFLQSTRAEKYPTIRWNFNWGKYVVVGVPDGITDQFVYEFKTTSSNFLLRFTKPIALTQADLYGYFFRRKEKRVQIYINEQGKTETWQEGIDHNRAEETLQDFLRVDTGWLPPPPQTWKCKKCDFKAECPITPLH